MQSCNGVPQITSGNPGFRTRHLWCVVSDGSAAPLTISTRNMILSLLIRAVSTNALERGWVREQIQRGDTLAFALSSYRFQ